MKLRLCIFAVCAMGASLAAASGLEGRILWPNPSITPTASHGEKAFRFTFTPELLKVAFSDIKNSDDYIHIDLGAVALKGFEKGGCVEIEAEVDAPILRIGVEVADPQAFWDSRQSVEGNAFLKSGRLVYRFYLDSLKPERTAAGKDHLYLFIQDLGGDARGKATVRVGRIELVVPTPDWVAEKRAVYAKQFSWPSVEKIEPLYYEDWTHAVNWAQVSSSPQLRLMPLAGEWRKKYFGEKTWDPAFLSDVTYAQPGNDDMDWKTVDVPEKPVPEQPGGMYWYRREVDVPPDWLGGRTYLRFDDLADDARLYVNGTLVGTQTSTEKRLDWVAENSSRYPFMVGVPVKKAVTWRNFERSGIPFPFDKSAIPEEAKRLLLPLYSGVFDWPFAYDITPFLKEGRNTIAVRLYGNPMKGWWIFRHRDDRAAQNVYGILGSVILAQVKAPCIESFVRRQPEKVDDSGCAVHHFQCAILPAARDIASKVVFRCAGQEKSVDVSGDAFSADFSLPARFVEYEASVHVMDREGRILESQQLSFHGVVVTVENLQLRVNGDNFLVRGINSDPGVEWENDRTLTRREFLRVLRQYQQLGINTLRLEGPEQWQLEEAQQHGMMVMATTCASSTDLSLGIFGQLVDPDYQLAWDRQKLSAVLLNSAPNILMWNGANEIHHTPGYDDRPILKKYLEGIRQAYREFDPYKRPVTFANLDSWVKNWFFFEGQDVVGWNIYQPTDLFEAQFDAVLKAAGGRPIIFTEWGTLDGEKDRKGKEDAWEQDMRTKWELISTRKGSVGGFLYAFHGELNDARGREFVRSLLMPFVLARQDNVVVFTNRSEAPMRDVEFQVVSGPLVSHADFVSEIEPGGSHSVEVPYQSGGTMEIRYDSHHGLKHFYSEILK